MEENQTTLVIQKIIETRKLLGISQKQIAEHLNVSAPHYNQIEKGTNNLKLEVFLQIAEKLGVPAFTLLYDEEKDKAIFDREAQFRVDSLEQKANNLEKENARLLKHIQKLDNDISMLKEIIKLRRTIEKQQREIMLQLKELSEIAINTKKRLVNFTTDYLDNLSENQFDTIKQSKPELQHLDLAAYISLQKRSLGIELDQTQEDPIWPKLLKAYEQLDEDTL
ncbi:helix-turn-helix domain-containing protein [Roseivirga seohaensis]|uniref:helix-turn-helix domain-containing protein n=1 Tax=Roseivirga seohaensis TaxID=1914963 RepID=UPI003BA9C5F9